MKFLVYEVRKNDINLDGVDIETIQELQELQNKYDNELIIDFDDNSITINNKHLE